MRHTGGDPIREGGILMVTDCGTDCLRFRGRHGAPAVAIQAQCYSVARSVSCEIARFFVTRRVSLEVALFRWLRAEGPAIYLAQPNGLGKRNERRQGPKVRPFASSHRTRQTNGRAVGPRILWCFRIPSPLDWARQRNGALPLNQKAQLQNASARKIWSWLIPR